MITLYKKYPTFDVDAAYDDLFTRARQLLIDNEILSVDAPEFTGIDDYFAHIGTLIKLNASYAMLPLDEAPFEIDANERTIKVPAAFNKCAGVQGDNLCEIITFTVDRYFDYVDLETTTIAIQWQSPNRQGIHLVDRNLRDIISRPGKIRFGWPLSSSVTETHGDVVFSIRFFIAPEDGGPVKYILNTLPAKINIKQTL